MNKEKVESKMNPAVSFFIGFLIMTLPYSSLLLLFDFESGYEEVIGAFILAIAFSIIGIIVAVLIRFIFKIRYISLGLLLGGFTTILIIKILDELVFGYF
jgi:hypothetical protein